MSDESVDERSLKVFTVLSKKERKRKQTITQPRPLPRQQLQFEEKAGWGMI